MRTLFVIGCLAALLAGGGTDAAWGQTYTLEASVLSGGGGTGTSGAQTLTGTVGQASPAGRAESGPLTLISGYPSPFFGLQAITIEVPLSDPGAQPSGATVTVQANVVNRVAEIDAVTLFYRPGGNASFSSTAMTSTGEGTFEGAIPGDALTNQGIAYYMTASDVEGNQARFPADGVLSFPVELGAPGIVKTDGQPAGTTQSAYRLIAVPLDANQKRPRAVLGDDISFLASAGAYDPNEARFFEPVGQTVSEFPRTNDMVAGKAFWLITRSGVDLWDTGPGTTFPLDGEFQIGLSEGWNFIGNPFNFSIPVDRLRTADGQDLVLRTYGSGGYNSPSNPVTAMQPFVGYAVFSESQTTLFVDPTPASGSSAAEAGKQQRVQARFDPDWRIRIIGRTAQAQDADNVAGVMRTATAGRDAVDWAEPPFVSGAVSVSFPRPGWGRAQRFSTDIRPVPARGDAWTFEVSTNAARPVSLVFDGVQQVPPGWDVWLLDEKLKVARDLQAASRYELDAPVPEEKRRFQLVVGTSAFVKERLQSAEALPGSYALESVFPNPSRGQTTIRFGLPQEEDVTVEVYNVLGQRVATLLQRASRKEGFHAVQWDGRDGQGAALASGVYFIRLRAGDFVATEKVVRVN